MAFPDPFSALVNAQPVSLHNDLPQPQGPTPEVSPVGPPPAPPQQGGLGGFAQLLPLLFGLGARLGGSPTVGASALQGFQQGQLLLEQQRQRQAAEQQRQQQLDMQAQQMALGAAQLAEQQRIRLEQQRQAAINTTVDNLRAQQFRTKQDYDAAITAHETMLRNAYGVRPHTLRAMVPFNAPDVATTAKAALDPMIKEYGLDQIARSGGFVEIDRDGDGVAERVPITDALQLAGIAVMRDPNGQLTLPPKGTTPQDVDDLTTIFQGVLGEWQAEGKNVSDPAIRGKAMLEAKTRLSDLQRRASGSSDVNWQTMETDQGLVQINPRTGQTRPVQMGGQTLRKPSTGTDPTAPSPADLYATERESRIVQSVDELMGDVSALTVGPASALALPGTPARDFAAKLETLKASIAFGELTEMRQASKTGGALGQVSDRELSLLSSTLGSLDVGQTPGQFRAQLRKVKASIERWQRAKAAAAAQGLGSDLNVTGDIQVPPQVTALLKSQPDGRYTLSDGSVWEKRGGVVTRVQ